MAQFLFVVDVPSPALSSEDLSAGSRWFEFDRLANAIVLPKGCPKKPARNVWLLPSEGVDTILSELIAAAKANRFQYLTFLLSDNVTQLTK